MDSGRTVKVIKIQNSETETETTMESSSDHDEI
jgi:hypothetical protein